MATLTITTTPQQDARLVVAFGRRLNLGRNATAAEIKADIISFVRAVVHDQERLAREEANQPSPFEPT